MVQSPGSSDAVSASSAHESVPQTQGVEDTGISSGRRAALIGLTATAALFLLLAGAFQFVQGLAAVIGGNFFALTPNFAYSLDVGAWGWIHLVLGILMVVTGFALLMGATWARVVGMVLALGSGMANFMFIPFYPAWAIMVIVLDVALIWALANYDLALD